jgi:hypothetical protein
MPSLAESEGYSTRDAVYVGRFYDDALISGRWPTIRSSSTWERNDWPMPEFHRRDSQSFAGQSFALQYSEDKPEHLLMRREISLEDEARFPPDDGMLAPERLEYLVAEILGAPPADDQEVESPVLGEEGVTHWLLIPPEAVEEARRQLTRLGFDDVAAYGEHDGFVDVLVSEHGDLAKLRSSVDELETTLTELASGLGGKYDGTEWALPQ